VDNVVFSQNGPMMQVTRVGCKLKVTQQHGYAETDSPGSSIAPGLHESDDYECLLHLL